jgi:hypothetical protein
MVQGTQNIFFAQLGDPDVTKYFSGGSRYMSGRFITMMFGLCAVIPVKNDVNAADNIKPPTTFLRSGFAV